eukprot:2453690-Pyramimonas_sp.AAC.1
MYYYTIVWGTHTTEYIPPGKRAELIEQGLTLVKYTSQHLIPPSAAISAQFQMCADIVRNRASSFVGMGCRNKGKGDKSQNWHGQ